MFQSAGLTGDELKSLIEVAEIELENLVSGKTGSLVKVGAVIHEIKMRSEMALHTELLYRFIAILYIREDENPVYWDEEIAREKIQAFKEMSKEGSYDFFHLPELIKPNEIVNLSPSEWEEFWNQSVREQERLKDMVELLKFGKEYVNLRNNSKDN